MQFSYVAYSINDGVVKGRIEATDADEARAAVVREGYKPLRVAPVWQPPSLEVLFPSLFHVGTAELVRFAKQMATMLASGGGLLRTLEMLQEETNNRAMRRTLGTIQNRLDRGDSLSAALAEHPKVFSSLFITVVEVGEHTGRLSIALEQMAEILEQEHETRQKAIQTMMYPLGIIGLSVITLLVLMTVAPPPLLSVFEQMDAELPVMTRIAVSGVNAITDNILQIPIGIIVGIFAFGLSRRIPRVKYWIDAAQARAPILGSFTVTGELSRFARTTAMLLEAEVPLSTAIQLGQGACKNMVIRRALADAEESLMSGHSVSEGLKRHSIVPAMFVQLVTIGEASNSLTRTMTDASNAYQKQYEQRLNALLGMLEPASTVIVGGIVGFIAMAMFVPIYSGISAIE